VTQTWQLQPGAEPYPGYRLHLPIGRGGFSEVWEAETAAGQRIALKFMATRGGNVAANEVRSIQALRQLRHPNLVRVDQVWCQPGYVVVAMELADGSLADLLDGYQLEQDTPIPPEELCGYLLQAADALDFLHRRQHARDGRRVAYQHCDVKPGNLLIFGRTAKLADYGLAAETTQAFTPRRAAGTLAFAAPEVFQGQLSDRSDQFSLAVTYCQLRSGRLPFPEPPRFSPTYTHPEPDLSMLSPPERQIIARALAPRPLGRWYSCGALVRRLARQFGVVVDESGFDAARI
jgi:serine/threonine protein kinase